MKDIIESLWAASKSTANLFLIVSFSSIFSWVMGIQQIPDKLAIYLLSVVHSPYTLLLVICIFLIIVGMLMDTGAAVILFAPILSQITYKAGINPIHFAIVMLFDLVIGLITPPVGLTLYATCIVGKEKFEDLVKAEVPFIVMGFAILALIVYFPEISLFVPRIFHLF
jgi:tripartite ATP-independent transporter DctM subunit